MIAACSRWLVGQAHTSALLSFAFRRTVVRGAQHRASTAFDAPAAAAFPPERVRNFAIIAHVDHGKSTLADRLMEYGGAVTRKHGGQLLDRLQVERERGITVKAQTASFVHVYDNQQYLLNLIDTPGHVDFSYEVKRALAACEGVLLLVDAAQGIQAQTIANYYLALESNLEIVPVLNKCDLPAADPDAVDEQLASVFGIETHTAIRASAKTGVGIREILDRIVADIPPARTDASGGASAAELADAPLRALLCDSWYDDYRGVVCVASVRSGELRSGEKIALCSSGREYVAQEVGMLLPEGMAPVSAIRRGHVGYVVTGMKTAGEARIGDTLRRPGAKYAVEAFPGFAPPQSMVFAGLYPVDASGYDALRRAIEKLTLNDASVSVAGESSDFLGMGFRCGFLGLLHLEVFQKRLEQEYGAEVIPTAPTVPYHIVPRRSSSNEEYEIVSSPADFPDPGQQRERNVRVEEPTVHATILCPSETLGPMLELCHSRRGVQLDLTYINEARALLRFELPLAEVVTDFYDDLKSLSQGYASFDYEPGPYRPADLVRLRILIGGEPVDALSAIVHAEKAQQTGRAMVKRLRESIDRQLFEVPIQAAVGAKILARETVPAMRKDVLAKCYGGDVTRKRKLLEKQKKGKKRMKRLGKVDISQEVFVNMLRR